MYTFTETEGNITFVKTRILDISYNLGHIEKGFGNVYLVTDYNNGTLKDGDSVIFTDYQKAYSSLVSAFRKEFDL